MVSDNEHFVVTVAGKYFGVKTKDFDNSYAKLLISFYCISLVRN